MTTRISGRPTRRSGRGMEAHPKVQVGSGVPPGGPGEVGKPTWRHGRIREDHPNILEAHTEVGRTTRRSRRDWDSHAEVWAACEAHTDVRNGSGVPPVGLGGVWRPTRRSRWDWEAHLEVREGSGGPSAGSGRS